MNRRDSQIDSLIDVHLRLFADPIATEIQQAQERARLQLLAETPQWAERGFINPFAWARTLTLATVATAVFVLMIQGPAMWHSLKPARSMTVGTPNGETARSFGNDGAAVERIEVGDVVRSSDVAGRQVVLADGSQVEMRAGSELLLVRADDGLTIQLRTGSIIVNAAKQRNGHLYVKTKDVTVAVVGTVFLVNVADEGSRVAVIEGEVRVNEGKVETRLRPGEQVSTSPKLTVRPLREEIAWSRHADAHLAILATFEKGMSATGGRLERLTDRSLLAGQAGVAAGQAFEEASIRPCDPDNVPAPPDGARGGGANSFYMTPGRTYALCMTLATLVRTAYGYGPYDLDALKPPGTRGIGPDGRGMSLNGVYGLGVEDGRRVRGGPDWIRTERYTIEAVASGPADAETMRGPMLQALLERRFNLKAHLETEQAPAFTLSVASGGLKIQSAKSGACEPMPPPDVPAVRIPRSFAAVRRGERPSCGFSNQANGPNNVIVGGELSLGGLAQWLGDPLGRVPVTDGTGISDKFNFILEFVWDENTPGRRRVLPQDGSASDVPRAASIFSALEEQLGLRLERSRTPREFIVVDRVERPNPD
jgi:uncharacterized protein (TIGR03435 family)